jgi:PAS domain S-box-containing protein
MITGEPNVNTAAEAVRLGAFDYLAKPVTGHNLNRVVRQALEQQQLAKERDHYALHMDHYRRELEAIFNSVNDGIVTIRPDLTVQHMNVRAAKMLGVSAESVQGTPVETLLKSNLSVALERVRKTFSGEGAQEELVVECKLPKQGNLFLGVSTAPLLDENGAQQGALLILRDLTRLHRLEQQLETQPQQYDLVGNSPAMQHVRDLISHVARTDTTTLISGESGTGKELVASALHYASSRADKPFVKVNCAALSDELLESELFGHVKGAFTGAHRDRAGRFEAADGGSILLDEIGDISPRLQMRLLRVLQELEFERVGDSLPIQVDVRIITSTNRDLEEKIAQGKFREDLYYRINVMRIDIPPLRQRPEDIPLLVDAICGRLAKRLKRSIKGVSKGVLDILVSRPWPGNVRELENWLEHALVVCHGDVIQPEHLPQGATAKASAIRQSISAAQSTLRMSREVVLDTLSQTDWNIAKTARMLGVARNTLYQRIREYGLEKPGK